LPEQISARKQWIFGGETLALTYQSPLFADLEVRPPLASSKLLPIPTTRRRSQSPWHEVRRKGFAVSTRYLQGTTST
jgi:hypothetical protein